MTGDQIIAILGVAFTVLVWLFPPEPVRRFLHIAKDSTGTVSGSQQGASLLLTDHENLQPPQPAPKTRNDIKFLGPAITENEVKVRRVMMRCWLGACALTFLAGIILKNPRMSSSGVLLYAIGFPVFMILAITNEYAVLISEKELVLRVPFKNPGHILPWDKITKVSIAPRRKGTPFLFIGDGIKLNWSGYRMIQQPEVFVAELRNHLKPEALSEAEPLMNEIEVEARMKTAAAIER